MDAHKDKEAVSRRQAGIISSLLAPTAGSQRLPLLAEPRAIELFIFVISFPQGNFPQETLLFPRRDKAILSL